MRRPKYARMRVNEICETTFRAVPQDVANVLLRMDVIVMTLPLTVDALESSSEQRLPKINM